MEALVLIAESLLQTALQSRVLVTLKRPASQSVSNDEARACKRIAKETRQRQDGRVHFAFEHELSRVVDESEAIQDVLDREEHLLKQIHFLKAKLFDATVEIQQTRRLAEKVSQQPVMQNIAKTSPNLFRARDEVMLRVLKLYKRKLALKEEELNLDREIRKKQLTARRLWSEMKRNKPRVSHESQSVELANHNRWLHHVLLTFVLESKIDWSQETRLAELILAAP